jgi:hypothetical protein
MSDRIAAWVLTEKATLSPESDTGPIRAMHFEAAKLLAASNVPVDRQSEVYREFLRAAAGAAIFHCGKYSVMGQLVGDRLVGDQSIGGVGNNPLPVAAFSGDEQVVRALLRGSTDVNNCHTHFGSALYVAVFKGHATIAGLLLDAGADISKEGDDLAALHIAALEGHELIVRLLLERGASISASFNAIEGFTALDMAVRGGGSANTP